jgi:hypothetical protein
MTPIYRQERSFAVIGMLVAALPSPHYPQGATEGV